MTSKRYHHHAAYHPSRTPRPHRFFKGFLSILFSLIVLTLATTTPLFAAPGTVTSLVARTINEIGLIWTTPDAPDTVDTYEIRYSTVAPFNWGDARTKVWTNNRPVGGAALSMDLELVTGLKPETTYYFAVKATAGGITGALSNVATGYAGAFTAGWTLPPAHAMDIGTLGVKWADCNNDGYLDAVNMQWQAQAGSNNESVDVFRYNGTGFTYAQTGIVSGYHNGGALGDLDNDGLPDVMMGFSGTGATARIFRNTGTAFAKTWQTADTDNADAWGSYSFGDFDNDGDLDVTFRAYLYGIKTYRNDGINSFSLAWSDTSNFRYPAFGDFDNDGDLDQVTGRTGGGAQLYINDGSGRGLFSAGAFGGGTIEMPLAVPGDYDNDGDLDILTGGGNETVSHIVVNEAGILSSGWNSPEYNSITPMGLVWGDVNNDGYLDVVSGGYAGGALNRMYLSKGDGTFKPKMEFSASPLKELQSIPGNSQNQIALGDYDGDGDLDILGSSANRDGMKIFDNRYYDELNLRNSPPIPPATVSGSSTNGSLTFTWGQGDDTGTGATSKPGLYYNVRVGDAEGSSATVSGARFSPLMGKYNSLISPAPSPQLGIKLSPARLKSGRTYYCSVQAIDSGLQVSTWTTGSFSYTAPPGNITDLTAKPGAQITLTWTAPGDRYNDGTDLAGCYDIRYSTNSALNWTTNWSDAIVWKSNRPVGGRRGFAEMECISGLTPFATYYFAIKTKNSEADIWSGLSNVATGYASAFVFGWQASLSDPASNPAHAPWGDFDNDGYLDFTVADNNAPQRIFINAKNGTFTDATSVGIPGGGQNVTMPADFNNDGALDIVNTYFSSLSYMRIWQGDGVRDNPHFVLAWEADPSLTAASALAVGDYDNDGDLDIVVNCAVGGNNRIRLFRNDNISNLMEIWQEPSNNANNRMPAWGDYDNDGDLDIAVANLTNLKVYRNDLNNAFSPVSLGSGYVSALAAFGDTNNDGNLDILISGGSVPNKILVNTGPSESYLLDKIGTSWSASETDNPWSWYNYPGWGDLNNDGYLDQVTGNYGLNSLARVYLSDGAGGFMPSFKPSFNIPGIQATGGHPVALGDYDNDGDLDILSAERCSVLVVNNLSSQWGGGNTAPSAPTNITGTSNTGTATVTFQWNQGSDSGTGATSPDGLYYNVRIGTSTTSNPNSVVSGATGGSTFMGNHLRPKISSGQLGIKAGPLKAETSYYCQVQTIDAGLRASDWSVAISTIYFNVPPSASTLTCSTTNYGFVQLRWTAAGDDGTKYTNTGGTYEIRYASYAFTGANFSQMTQYTSGVPSPAAPGTWQVLNCNLSSSNESNGSYYFAMKTYDAKGNPSGISNVAMGTSLGLIKKLAFITVPQTLSAGTTSTLITVEARDQYDHPVVATETLTLPLTSTTEMGKRFFFNTSLNEITGVSLANTKSQASFYYVDYVAGSSTITVSGPTGSGWTPRTQCHTITPGPAAKLSLSFPDGVNAPVNGDCVTRVSALDQHDNVDPSYQGSVFVSASQHASSFESPGMSTYTFIPGDKGKHDFLTNDLFMEDVTVTAVDIDTLTITGTSPVLSFKGAYVTNPILTIAPAQLYQLDIDKPMLKFDLTSSLGTPTLTGLRVDLTGTALAHPSQDIARVKLYVDKTNSQWEGAANEVFAGSTTFNALGYATITLSSTQVITAGLKTFYVTFDMTSDAWENDTAGVSIGAATYFNFDGASLAKNYLPLQPSTSNIMGAARTVSVTLVDYTPEQVVQGQKVPMLQFQEVLSNAGNIPWTYLKLKGAGTCAPADIKTVELYTDTNKNGLVDSGLDNVIASSTMSPSGYFEFNFNETLTSNISTATYLAVATIDPRANTSGGHNTFGLQFTYDQNQDSMQNFRVLRPNGYVLNPWAASFSTRISTINPTTDRLMVTPQPYNPDIYQGGTDSLLQLSLTTDQNSVVWTGLQLDVAGSGSYSDITEVEIFNNVGTRIGHKAPTSSTVLVYPFDIKPELTSDTTQVFYVKVRLSATAARDKTIELHCANTGYFYLDGTTDYTGNSGFPFYGSATIKKYPAVVTVISSCAAQASYDPGKGDLEGRDEISLITMRLSTDLSTALWSGIQVDRLGTAANADITAVKVFRDITGNGTFDSNALLLSSGTDYFTGMTGSLYIPLKTSPDMRQTIIVSTQTYFVTVSLSPSVEPNTEFGLSIKPSYLTVDSGRTAPAADPIFNSRLCRVKQPASVITVLGTSLLPATTEVMQGQSIIVAEELKLKTDRYSAVWSVLQLYRATSGSIQIRDSDISKIRLYKDTGNGSYDAGDQRINGENDRFIDKNCVINLTNLQTITTDYQTYYIAYDVSETAVSSATCGIRMVSGGAFTFDGGNSASPDGFPINSGMATIIPTIDTMQIARENGNLGSVMQTDRDKVFEVLTLNTNSRQVSWTGLKLELAGSADDSDVSAVKIYRDNNENKTVDESTDTLIGGPLTFDNRQVTIPIVNIDGQPEVLTTSPKKYLIACDISQTAAVSASVGLRCAGTTWYSVIGPDLVGSPNAAWESVQPAIADQADTVYASCVNLAGGTVDQGAANAPFIKVGLRVDHDEAGISDLQLLKTGNLSQAEVNGVSIYYDLYNDGLDQGDPLIARALTKDANPAISANYAQWGTSVPFQSQLITPTTKYYIITCDLTINALVGRDIGFKITNKDFITLQSAQDSVSSANFPLNSAEPKVRDIRTPTTPVVLDGGDYTYIFEELNGSWTSQVISGRLDDAQYAVGTTSYTADVVPWMTIGTNNELNIKGLSLRNAITYYLLVKTRSSYGFWSDIGASDGIRVDLVEPQIPGTPLVVKGTKTYLVTWPPAQCGESGVLSYVLEERSGLNPKWVVVSTKTAVSSAITRGGAVRKVYSPPDTSQIFIEKPAGTYYYRIRAENGAGKWSEYSEVVRVVFGAATTADIISEVANYPNPFDSRSGKTTIHYSLNQNTGVKVRIYDLFGHLVKEMSFSAGQDGGMMGSNEIPWDGTATSGKKVSMGGYVAVITADAQGPNNEVVSKVAVIH